MTLLPLRTFGRYVMHEEIAAGGMATVHLGRLLGPVGFTRTIAIKRLHPQFAKDPEFVTMFLDEARLAARINHPNVIQTLDVVASEGEVFLIMDYVQGESLARLHREARAREETIPLRVLTTVLCGALHGLHAAHEATGDHGESLGIVHRDVSPQNILVGVDGIARVLDFGVAKAVGRAHVTREGHLKGKLAYMAPEQLEGHVSRQADVFAASIVLWEALTGERLFKGDDERAMVGQILTGTVDPPSRYMSKRLMTGEATPEQLESLDRVALRGLALRPEDRFESARKMAFELEKAVGIVSQVEVGEWVDRVGGESLRTRARRIVDIESRSVDAAAAAPAAVPMADVATRVHVQSPTVGGLISAPPAPTRSGIRGAALASAGGLVGVLLVAGLYPRPRAVQSSVTTPAAASVPAFVDSTSGVTPAPSVPTLSEPTLVVASSRGAGADTSPALPERGAITAKTTVVKRSDAGAVPQSRRKLDCDPPYTLDSAGQHFKEECFH